MSFSYVIPRTRKKRGEGASRRGEILAAASRIFLEEGVAGATMRRIAAAVGVSPTALYVYFPDKPAILQAIAAATFADLLASLHASQQSGGSAEDRLRASMRAYVDFGVDHPDAYRLTFLSDASNLPETPCKVDDADAAFGFLVSGVEEMMRAGLFAPSPAMETAEIIWAALHGVTSLLLNQTEHLASGREQLTRRVIDLVIVGLRPN